jgi:hypothetical protein
LERADRCKQEKDSSWLILCYPAFNPGCWGMALAYPAKPIKQMTFDIDKEDPD